MPIQADQPFVIPAVEQKTFPHLWIYNLVVHAPTTDTGRICVETLPYNDATGEIAAGVSASSVSTDKLWQAVNEVPEVAQAFGAVLAAVGPLKAWVAAQESASQPQT